MNQSLWIKAPVDTDRAAVSFRRVLARPDGLTSAVLKVSGIGVYRVTLGGKKLGRAILAPGWTSYDHRVQYKTFDLTEGWIDGDVLEITVAPGWAVGRLSFQGDSKLYTDHLMAAAQLVLTDSEGRVTTIDTDESWEVYTNEVTFADIYDGETIDKTHTPVLLGKAVREEKGFPLVPQVGADVTEQEHLCPVRLILTPKGERVLDFGQNMSGYVTLKICGNRGERVVLSYGEVLDKEGNFYNANYRSAKNRLTYILSGKEDFFKPSFSFQGFRYVRIDEYPEREIELSGFEAVVIHTDMTRTGRFACGDAKINQLYHNIIWGHKSNYVDLPTDCPQRDERLGWTGDTQAFCRVAAMNYDVRAFFRKWLGDLRLEQREDGAVWGVCPQRFGGGYTTRISAGWGDVATIVPWELYMAYGDKSFLSDNFEMMKNWVEYQRSAGDEEYLWLGGYHYGDWLAMDAGEDSYVGATSNDLIASAFYAHSVDLLIRAGEVLGKDMSEYRTLHENVRQAFRAYFMENGSPKEEFPMTEVLLGGRAKHIDTVRQGMTQTAIVLILTFDLCTDAERPALADKLVALIDAWGGKMTTGFLGTPYLLHALTREGRVEEAYKLFFAEENPSWLYSVNHGATTMWEHWNGIKEDGSFWSTDMNSYNHYAYGAVGDWMYGEICGVQILEPGYKRIRLAPKPCERLSFAKCAIDTVSGRVESHWYYTADCICFEFTVPTGTEAEICLPDGSCRTVKGGSYCFAVAR